MFFEEEIQCSLVPPYATHPESGKGKEAYQLQYFHQIISNIPILMNPKICAGLGPLDEFFLEGAVQLGVVSVAHEQAPEVSGEL